MSKVNHKLGRKLVAWALVVAVANTLGALGYTPAAGARYCWRRLDHAVMTALVSVP